MPSSKIPSPARSQGVILTPRKQVRRTRSVGSPATTSIQLSSMIESYKVSPIPCRQSVLNDDTDIDIPRRLSWWKKIDDHSRDVLELLERKEIVEVNNVVEEFDVEVLSQENKNYALDLPESSDGESINSIVIPQRKLFTQKENQPQKTFGQIKNNREKLQKLNKSYVDHDKELNVGRKTLFSQPSKPRTKPVFPAALLDISANKTVNKTKEIPAAEVKGQVRSLFGCRPGTKRKNMFADFIVSESEDEISEIQPKVFGFQKKNDPKRRANSMSRHSPRCSIDLEMDDWKLLPSSTMVENQINDDVSPVKRIKFSNLLETKDSEISTNSNNTLNKTKQTNKSISSKNKSKNLSNIHHKDDKSHDIHMTPRNATINNSRVTRSMGKSFTEDSVTASNISKNVTKIKNQTQSNKDNSIELKTGKTIKILSQSVSDSIQENPNVLIDHPDPDEDFTLESNNEVAFEIGSSLKNYEKNPEDKTASNLNVDVVDNNDLVKESNGKISQDTDIEQEISANKICENQQCLLENKQNDIKSNKVSNNFSMQNNSQEVRNIAGLNNDDTIVKKLNKSMDKSKSKSRNSVEKYNELSRSKNMQKETSAKEQSIHKDTEKNEKLSKSSQNLNEENYKDQEMESEDEQNDNYYEQHSDKEEESTQEENNYDEIEEEINEDEQSEHKSLTENVSEEDAEQEVINESNTNENDNNIISDDQRDNTENKNQVTLPIVSHDTTGRHIKINKSPEVILHDKTKQMDSFTVQPRNTSVRKTKSIIFHNKLDTVTDSRRSTGFSDATGNSSAEGSGWDSHRTTRKTLRQTFGKDFTPRKSLRALVMEKTAKLQANFSEAVDNIKIPQANSTEYDQVQDELDSYQETEVEQNIGIVPVDQENEAIQIEKDHEVDVRDVTERLKNKNKSVHLEETDKTERIEGTNKIDQSKIQEKDKTGLDEVGVVTEQSEKGDQLEERNEMDLSINEQRDEREPFEEMETTEQTESFERSETKHFDEREVEESEVREEVEESEVREEVEESEEREEMEESEKRERMEESEERQAMEEFEVREEVEESEERGEMEESEEREEMEESEEREEMEESEVREEVEESEERGEMEESEEREEMEESEEREEMEESDEREEMEESEAREEMEQSDEREESEKSENEDRDETEAFGKTDDMEQSDNEERIEAEQFEERDEMEQSEDEERNDVEPFEERDEMEQSEDEERNDAEQFEERDEMEQSEDETEQLEERNDTVPENEKMAVASAHEVSQQTRQTSLETYLQKIQQDNAEKRRKMQEELRNSLKNPKRDAFSLFKVPQRPVQRSIKIQKPKAKKIKSVIPLEMLPSEVIEDMKYKPPKRFQPNNASWITKRLYKFLENKLEPKYDYKARIRAEKLVQCIYNFTKEVRRHDSVRSEGIEELKREMARLDIVKTHFDFYEFCHEFFPREIRIKVVPDIVNNIQLPRHGVFSDILR